MFDHHGPLAIELDFFPCTGPIFFEFRLDFPCIRVNEHDRFRYILDLAVRGPWHDILGRPAVILGSKGFRLLIWNKHGQGPIRIEPCRRWISAAPYVNRHIFGNHGIDIKSHPFSGHSAHKRQGQHLGNAEEEKISQKNGHGHHFPYRFTSEAVDGKDQKAA